MANDNQVSAVLTDQNVSDILAAIASIQTSCRSSSATRMATTT
jgi:hypothetical protein